MQCDLVLWCTGSIPNTKFVANSWPDKLDADGAIRVDEHLRVVGFEDVFAIGDCNNVPETKLASTAWSNQGVEAVAGEGQADVCLANIKVRCNHYRSALGPVVYPPKLRKYVPKEQSSMIVSVGDSGVGWNLPGEMGMHWSACSCAR